MDKKENRLEVFKSALISTIKSISEKKDCEIKFGKSSLGDNNKVVNLPELSRINSVKDFSLIRAKADSEALRLRYSDMNTFNLYKPKGNNASKLYEVAEKIRYEKIGSDHFRGIKKNLFENYNEKKNEIKLIEDVFDNYLRSFFFETKEVKNPDGKIKKNEKKSRSGF